MTLYPGLGLPLRHYPKDDTTLYPLGLHAHCPDSESAMLPVREVAMMNLMERLTDKEDWQKKIFNEEIVKEWRKEALEHPNKLYWKQATDNKGADAVGGVRRPPGIMDTATFDYCVKELRNKANYYVETGLIPTLDASATVVKSDILIPVGLQTELQEAFNRLKADQGPNLNWHPNSNQQVLDLVHPSMYPLVYGRTRVLQDEVVGTTDAIDKWAGKGEFIAKDTSAPSRGFDGSLTLASFWSNTYQWLPSNVKFLDDESVRFTSYINNLHPQKYPEIYRTIEKLIETTLPAWDQCLSLPLRRGNKIGAGRTEPRFPKQDFNDNDSGIWDPSSPPPLDDNVEADDEIDDDEGDDDEDYDEDYDPAIAEWERTRKPVHPCVPEFEDINYAKRDTARLAQKFKNTGLQVIVKMTSVELTPEKPEFPAREWHVDGHMNERICASALYCIDSENITPRNVHFRMQTSYDIDHKYPRVSNYTRTWLESTHGTSLMNMTAPCLQIYGTVQMRGGRLMAFPNVFQHRESSFKLEDPSKPGSRYFISLRLVDPNTRIISTANVPPQQYDWWVSAVFGQSLQSNCAALTKLTPDLVAILEQRGFMKEMHNSGEKLPPELLNMVRAHFYNNNDDNNRSYLPMSEEEAKEHLVELMNERIEYHIRADLAWSYHTYRLFPG
ncbi:hypothetical protein ACHAQJ_007159 [Trichoderma viride]